MSKFELFIARWLARRVVSQGAHAKRLTELYTVIRSEAQAEFVEDSHASLDAFLLERFVATTDSKEKINE